MKLFEDRAEAGRKLAKELVELRIENPIVIAIPRGGVVVGFEIAKILRAPLDVIIARKLGAPEQSELGIGAIAEENIKILDKELIRTLKIPKNVIDNIINKEKQEIERRRKLYRDDRSIVNFKNKTVILVDDGVATGITAKATIDVIKRLSPKKIIFAVPVCPSKSTKDMGFLVDEFICLYTPVEFDAVGTWYNNFEQVTDEEVKALLGSFRR